MGSSTSYGWGIALQSKGIKDYASKMGENYAKVALAREKQERADQKAADKALKDATGMLKPRTGTKYVPMFLKKIDEVFNKGMDEIVALKTSGATTSAILLKAQEYNQELQRLDSANERAYAIYEDKQNLIPENYKTILMNPNGKPEDLVPFNNAFFGINVVPETYDISYTPIPSAMNVPKLTRDRIDVPTGNVFKERGGTVDETRSFVDPASIEKAASDMLKDPTTARQLAWMAIFENSPDVIQKLAPRDGETAQEYMVRNHNEALADPSIPDIAKRSLEIAKERVTANSDKELIERDIRPQPRKTGTGKTAKDKVPPPVIPIPDTDTNQSDFKSDVISSVQIRVENDQKKKDLEAMNPSLQGLIEVGDELVFTPNTARGNVKTDDLTVAGTWNLSDDKVKLKNRGKETQAIPNTNGLVPYVYIEGPFQSSLGGGAKAEDASYIWYADMLNYPLDIKSYDNDTQQKLNKWAKANKKSIEVAIGYAARKMKINKNNIIR